MTLKDMYEEFWEFIDEDNEEFSEFIKNDVRRRKCNSFYKNYYKFKAKFSMIFYSFAKIIL